MNEQITQRRENHYLAAAMACTSIIWIASPCPQAQEEGRDGWLQWMPLETWHDRAAAFARARELRQTYHGHLVGVRPNGSAPPGYLEGRPPGLKVLDCIA